MIAVTGATGNIGSALVRTLSEADEKVVAISRGEQEIRLPAGVEHRRADIGDPAALAAAVAGAQALFLLLSGEQGIAGPPPAEVLDAVRAAGIGRVVLVSSLSVASRPRPTAARLLQFEALLRESDLEWTILRAGGFFTNSFAWAESVRTQRAVYAPFGDVALPHLDPSDIAEVAAAALISSEHAGQTYTLTGPAPITPREQAAIIADALGEAVAFHDLTRAQALTAMTQFMPEPIADETLSILGEPLPAELAVSADTEKVLGRSATPFTEWASRNVTAFL
ncbi:uncharacterized protein YbjT (DUF2867 family) [Nocardia sp. GAS34]|uniref:NAD(P)H-binding protein n=1 Tax=unclassified Nocardia TaxID=2637762 RepID=UPI003D22D386